jgi:hypothetical protein
MEKENKRYALKVFSPIFSNKFHEEEKTAQRILDKIQ